MIKACHLTIALTALTAGALAETYENPVIGQDWPDPTFWQAPDGWVYGVATCLKTTMQSRDLVHWEDTRVAPITDADRAELAKFANSFWAPDAVKVGDEWRLYVTQFKSSDTNRLVVLSARDPRGPFRYRGVVLENWKKGIRDCAIDADVVPDGGRLWLFIGSVAGGVWRTWLTPDGLAVDPDAPFEHVAGLLPGDRDRKWIYSHRCYEGSYLYRRGGWWYLFASAGSCIADGYRLYVGRSRTLDGVFVDRTGRKLTESGGETLLETKGDDPEFLGPGHNGEIFADAGGRTYMFFHSHWKGCPGNGRSALTPRCLNLQEVLWDDDGWPWFRTGAVTKTNVCPDFGRETGSGN